MEQCICPGMAKGLCFMPTFTIVSVFYCMNNLRKMILYLPSNLLLSLKKPMQLLGFFPEGASTPDYFCDGIVWRSDGFRRGKSWLHQCCMQTVTGAVWSSFLKASCRRLVAGK